MPTLAEDLLLLLLDDTTGKPQVNSVSLDYALAGAVLAELAMAGRIEVASTAGFFGGDKVGVVNAAPTGDDIADAALQLAGVKPRGAERLVPKLSKGLRKQLLERLEQRGILHRESARVLGIFPRDRWPTEDASEERALRQRLHDVLVVGMTPDERTAAIAAMLAAVDQAHKLFDADRVERKAVKARAKSLAEGNWTAAAVRKAVQAAHSSTAAATSGGVVAVSASI
jgi:hypothetical protein